MTNELGTTLQELEDKAERKREVIDAYELICSQVPSAEWMDKEMQRASETIRQYIEQS